GDQGVDRVDRRRPRSSRSREVGPMGNSALLADREAHSVQLLGHLLVELDDIVEGIRDLAGETRLGAPHPHREIPLPDRGQYGLQLVEVEGIGAAGGGGGGGRALGLATIAGRRGRHGGSGNRKYELEGGDRQILPAGAV